MEQNTNPCGLCSKGCGFYGNDAYEGMCSKCFKDNVKRQQQTPATPPTGTNLPDNATSDLVSKAQQSAPTASPSAIPVSSASSSPTSSSVVESNTDLVQQPNSSCSSDTCLTPISKPVPDDESVENPEQSSTSSDSPFEEGSPGDLKKRNRCYSCKKKVGLTGFECRCGGLYCGLHRYSDKHNCTFDYKSDGREQLAKANPVIVGEKVKKL